MGTRDAGFADLKPKIYGISNKLLKISDLKISRDLKISQDFWKPVATRFQVSCGALAMVAAWKAAKIDYYY